MVANGVDAHVSRAAANEENKVVDPVEGALKTHRVVPPPALPGAKDELACVRRVGPPAGHWSRLCTPLVVVAIPHHPNRGRPRTEPPCPHLESRQGLRSGDVQTCDGLVGAEDSITPRPSQGRRRRPRRREARCPAPPVAREVNDAPTTARRNPVPSPGPNGIVQCRGRAVAGERAVGMACGHQRLPEVPGPHGGDTLRPPGAPLENVARAELTVLGPDIPVTGDAARPRGGKCPVRKVGARQAVGGLAVGDGEHQRGGRGWVGVREDE